MRAGRLFVLLVVGVAGLSACTSDEVGTAGAPPTPSTGTVAPDQRPAGPIPPLPEVGEVPVLQDAGFEDAVRTFGSAEVAAALTADAQIAKIALADCWRWTTGDVDPRLTLLVAPELLTRALDELARSEEYGGSPIPSLLSHLPEDDGNGNDEAADVAGGCDDSAPLRYGPMPATARVDRSQAGPRLVLTGSFVLHVTLGDTRVQAGQDWEFTSERTANGWRLIDADPSAHVNWAPPLPE